MKTMSNKRIFLASPHMSEEGYEKEYIEDAFAKNFIAPLGENVNAFEKELAQKVGAGDAAALSAGTAAIHMGLLALGVRKGDLVFCQSLTFSASANPICYVGAEPVFIDSEKETWNMSPKALEKAFEKYEKLGKLPKAVVFVHLYGIAANLDAILPICERYQVPVLEDAAESLGTTYTGEITGGQPKYTGTFGKIGIYSFNGNKIITTSGGGMLVCNDKDEQAASKAVQKVRFWSTQAREQARHYQHEEIGYNYRMSNIVAGIGRGQLKVLDERIAKKREIFDYYSQNLGSLKGVQMMPHDVHSRDNCWLSVMLLSDEAPVTPLDVMEALEKDNIESRPLWKPMHLQPVFADCDFIGEEEGKLLEKKDFSVIDKNTGADNSVSGILFKQGVCLPSDTKNTAQDMERICGIIKKLWE